MLISEMEKSERRTQGEGGIESLLGCVKSEALVRFPDDQVGSWIFEAKCWREVSLELSVYGYEVKPWD